MPTNIARTRGVLSLIHKAGDNGVLFAHPVDAISGYPGAPAR